MVVRDLVDRARAAVDAGDLDGRGFGFERLSGGMTHAVLAPIDAPEFVVKVFTSRNREEPSREWEALVALAGSGLAPEPVHVELGEPATVVMTRVVGSLLPAPHLGDRHAAMLGSAHRLVHGTESPSRRPPSHAGVLRAWMSLRAHSHSRGDSASDTVARAWRAAREWVSVADVERILSSDELCFSRGDPNLTNYLWTDDGVVLVDWENSGLSDPVLEFADFAEHANSRALTDGFLDALAEASGLRRSDSSRVLDARRLMSCFWFVLIASRVEAGGPTTITVGEQAQRTLEVLGL